MRILAATAVVLLLATGCSDLEDKAKDTAKDAAGSAACALARESSGAARDAASDAVDQIGADPAKAEQELSAVRDSLAAAEKSLSGDVRAQVAKARGAVEDLLAQASRAADGTEVDDRAVERARGELDQAIDGVDDVC